MAHGCLVVEAGSIPRVWERESGGEEAGWKEIGGGGVWRREWRGVT
jgi:hypothetical protein